MLMSLLHPPLGSFGSLFFSPAPTLRDCQVPCDAGASQWGWGRGYSLLLPMSIGTVLPLGGCPGCPVLLTS